MTGNIYEEMGWKLLHVLLEEIRCRKLITMLVISFGGTGHFSVCGANPCLQFCFANKLWNNSVIREWI